MLFCDKEKCKYRSRRPSKVKTKSGEPLYRCKAKNVFIEEFSDFDGFDYSEENTCACTQFELKNKKESEEK